MLTKKKLRDQKVTAEAAAIGWRQLYHEAEREIARLRDEVSMLKADLFHKEVGKK